MNNWWIRFGCFLTGYNYGIVRNSSEVAAKSVKRYTAALVIVCIIWAFVGYTFTHRYLQGSYVGSAIGALIAVVIIIQIERQIILSMTPNTGLYIFRGFLALLMALIGAVIIDQIILKQDIELEKITYIAKRVDAVLPSRSGDLKSQLMALDSTIQNKERERQGLIDDVARQPLIANISSNTVSVPTPETVTAADGSVKSTTEYRPSTSYSRVNSPNPKQALLAPLDTLISKLRVQKAAKDNDLLNVRPALEKEITSKVGFLDELEVMYSLISKSGVAFSFWLLWFLFLLFIEMLVLFSKLGDKENDYERTVMHQMNLQIKKLELLGKG